jgi:uncharacterized protein with PIN domain
VSAPLGLLVEVHPDLAFLLPAARRFRPLRVPLDGTSTLRHVVSALGVPPTEVGAMLLDGVPAGPSDRAGVPGRLEVRPVARPQHWPTDPPRFLLDVHLGSLARRLRLLGVDTAYRNDADDDELVAAAVAGRRVLLTLDRGLLARRALLAGDGPGGAFVRGATVDEQCDDVLDRFAPPLAPWTRCGACNGELEPVDRADVLHLLEPGTRRSYDEFARCRACGRPYWRGAHSPRLERSVARAQAVVAARRPDGERPGA